MADSKTDAQAWELFVPEQTRENYRQIARDIARTEGTTPKAGLAKLAKGFEEQHERDPLGGWDHLAEWAKAEGDPGDGVAPGGEAYEIARAVESAKREPKLAYQSHPDALAAAKEAVETVDSGVLGAPVKPDEGIVPNSGPVSVDPKTPKGK